MKVLLDHNLPHKLRIALEELGGHGLFTTSFLGWSHLKNGELLGEAEAAGFEVFVTGDRTLVLEQNLAARRISIIALSANNWPIIKAFVPRIHTAIEQATPGSLAEVDCGEFSRRRPPDQRGPGGHL